MELPLGVFHLHLQQVFHIDLPLVQHQGSLCWHLNHTDIV